MSEEEIDREEVVEIFAALADYQVDGAGDSRYFRTARMKRTKTTFRTPEERKPWLEGALERQRALEARVEKMRAEQAAKRESA